MGKREQLLLWVFFEGGWFGSVWLAKTSYSWLALLFPAFLFGFLLARGRLTRGELAACGAVAVVGIAFDSALAAFKLVSLDGQMGFLAPVWLISIWLLFSCSMIKSGPSLRLPIGFAAALGFVLGPLSYKSGEVFQVLFFLTPLTVWVYAAFWALAFPSVITLSRRVA